MPVQLALHPATNQPLSRHQLSWRLLSTWLLFALGEMRMEGMEKKGVAGLCIASEEETRWVTVGGNPSFFVPTHSSLTCPAYISLPSFLLIICFSYQQIVLHFCCFLPIYCRFRLPFCRAPCMEAFWGHCQRRRQHHGHSQITER